jgi:hypothetical protein
MMRNVRHGTILNTKPEDFEIILIILHEKHFAYGDIRGKFSARLPISTAWEHLWKETGSSPDQTRLSSEMVLGLTFFFKAPLIILVHNHFSENIKKNNETKENLKPINLV